MSNFKDPEYSEMRAHLLLQLERFYYATEFEMEEAIYWYAHDYHGGQWTNLYATLSLSPFKPGAYSTGLGDGADLEMYQELQFKYGGA